MRWKNAVAAATLLAAASLAGCLPTDGPIFSGVFSGRTGATTPMQSLQDTPPPPATTLTDCGGTTAPVFTGHVVASGDLLGQGLMQILSGKLTEATVTNLTTNSSGLARPDFYDTVSHFSAAVAETAHPGDIAVIWLGANDNQSLTNADGSVAVYISHEDEWEAAYAARISSMAQTCVISGIDCYWLVPTASDASAPQNVGHRNRMGVIKDLIEAVADNPSYVRNVHVVDVWTVRDDHPGWDFAHPGTAGFVEAANDVASDVLQTKGVCLM